MLVVRLITLCAVFFSAQLFAQTITECDVAAAHPSDPDRITTGVPTDSVVTQVAIPACRRALADDPGNARLQYQLGRAIYYWAEANNGDPSEGIAHVRGAAEKGHRQAMFVHGLLLSIHGDVCAGEPFTKKAAESGLKSARVAYVNSVLSGAYAPCTVSASMEQMEQYLVQAESQMSGYYESMLLDNLVRQLSARKKSN